VKIAAGALAVIAVLIGWYAIDNRGKMNTRIEELTVELNARTAYITELEDTVTARQVTLDSLVKATQDSVEKAEIRANRHRTAADSARAALDGAITGLDASELQKANLRREISAMVSNYEAALDAKTASIIKLARLNREQSAQVERYISLNAELHIQVEAALELADEWKAEANPDFLSKLTRNPLEKVVFASAFMLAGAAIAK